MDVFLKKYSFALIICAVLGVFLSLSYKDVYSERSLIPNLEPYPDSLYYAAPAWNFVHGEAFSLKIGETTVKSATPPLYSILLVPFFAIFQDVRSFYFANMILIMGAILLHMMSLKNIFKPNSLAHQLLIGFIGFLFATCFYVYTMPTLLMAEPLSLFLVSMGLYLFTLKPSAKRDFAASQIAALLLLVKFSNFPASLILQIMFMVKLWQEPHRKKSLTRFIKFSCLSALYVGTYFLSSQILAGHKNLQNDSGFAQKHFERNFQWYVRTLIGGNSGYLWFSERFISPIIAGMGFIGMLVGLHNTRHRFLTLTGVFTVMGTVLFMSFFIVADARYIVLTLLFIFLFVAHSIFFLDKKIGSKGTLVSTFVIVMFLFFVKPLSYKTNAQESMVMTYRKQVVLNLKFSETPWNYIAVKEINNFISSQASKSSPVYVGTFLPPTYVDFYSNGLYQTLPIDPYQEFYWLSPEIRQDVFDENLLKKYERLVEAGAHIYVTPYYLNNNSASWQPHYDALSKSFKLEKVYTGCSSVCDIFQVKKLYEPVSGIEKIKKGSYNENIW